MSKLSLLGVSLLVGCGPGIASEGRIPSQSYQGEIDAARLADGVKELESSSLRVDFFPCNGGQCAEVDFDGKLAVIGIVIDGSPPQTVEGVLIDGKELSCETEVNGYLLRIEGTFSKDRSILDASVYDILMWSEIFLGSIRLERIDPEPDTGGDTATPGDTGDGAS